MNEITPVKYHTSIYDLPLNKFIDCIVDNNLSALIISGYPTPLELTTAWDLIMGQYADSVGAVESKMYMEMMRETAMMKITLVQINGLAAKGNDHGELTGILRVIPDEYLSGELNKLVGTNFKFNWADQHTYQLELDMCVNRSKAIKLQMDLKNIQFKVMQEKNEAKPGVKMDRRYFTSILITLSDHCKYRIEDNINMAEYCDRIKRFTDHCEMMKNQ